MKTTETPKTLTPYWRLCIAEQAEEEFLRLLSSRYPHLVTPATSNNPIYRKYQLELEHITFVWKFVKIAQMLPDNVIPQRILEQVTLESPALQLV